MVRTSKCNAHGAKRQPRNNGGDHHSRADYTLFEGRKVRGSVKTVWSRGTKVVDGDEWLGRPGHGNYVKRGEVGGF